MAAYSCVVGTAVGTSKRTPDSLGGGGPAQLRPAPVIGDTTGSAFAGGATLGGPARSQIYIYIYIYSCIYIYIYIFICTHSALYNEQDARQAYTHRTVMQSKLLYTHTHIDVYTHIYTHGHSEASRRLPEPVRNCRGGDRRWWEGRRLGRKFELYICIYIYTN